MFCTVINCMDGRIQLPVNKFMQKKYGFPYVDSITEAGPVAIVANKSPEHIWESMKRKLDISINVHGSKVIGVFAHHDCAGNPISKEEQIHQLKQARENLKKLYSDLTIVTGWINSDWEIEEIL